MNTGTWLIFAQKLRAFLQEHSLAPSQCMVLLPYAQLLGLARAAWLKMQPQGFIPEFATTYTLTQSLPKMALGVRDLRGQIGLDLPQAHFWLAQVNLPWQDQAVQDRLVAMAHAVMPLAQAQAPSTRMHWYEQTRDALTQEAGNNPWLAQEAALTQLALLWAAQSNYASDVLYSQKPNALVVLQGLQENALSMQLLKCFQRNFTHGPSLQLQWDTLCQEAQTSQTQASPTAPNKIHVYQAQDIAQEAAASVTLLLGAVQKKQTVALIAQDRLLTRRISALLEKEGVTVQDETGWPLSTTAAAATLLNPLQAALPQAQWADLLPWLRSSPAFSSMDNAALEAYLASHPGPVRALPWVPEQVWVLRNQLRSKRSLPEWLQTLRGTLEASEQWDILAADTAGWACIQTLFLDKPTYLPPTNNDQRWSLPTFIHWLRQVLESERFRPPVKSQSSDTSQVWVLPLEQLLGRNFAQVVFAGCDASHFARAPEAPPWWSAKQRSIMGFVSSDTLLQARTLAWQQALRAPSLHIVFRLTNADQMLSPSPYLESLLLTKTELRIQDASTLLTNRQVHPNPIAPPAPSAPELLIEHLSASAYSSLRNCPYQFFAQRILGLHEVFNPDEEPNARAYGTWLHAVLQRFHVYFQTLAKDSPSSQGPQSPQEAATSERAHFDTTATALESKDLSTCLASASGQTQVANLLDAIAQEELQRLGLDIPAFLPWRSIWPRVRRGYLEWLCAQQQAGWCFVAGELPLQRQISTLSQNLLLKGVIDRVDTKGQALTLIDYKSESQSKSQKRIKEAAEDVQLAFYTLLLQAALTQQHSEQAPTSTPVASETPLPILKGILEQTMYLGLDAGSSGDLNGRVQAHCLPEPLLAAEELLNGIVNDIDRITQGHTMPALGEGAACNYCSVRGLCQRDYWK